MKVTLEHLTKIFPSRNKKTGGEVIAVNDFTFDIPDGQLIGLLGPSGCGKSTALNLISGLEKPTAGRIFFGEEDVTDVPPEHRGVGLVFQNYALYPHLTVRQNIIFPLQNLKGEQKLTKEQMDEKALEAAKVVQIDALMDRRPGELSGGQQQRVAIARALVKTPNVLLLDEPLSNLDARLRLQTREELRRIQRQTGVTTIFVTHDQEEAMSISDLIVVMETGVIQQIGRPQDVYDDPVNLFVAKFLGTPAINTFEGTLRDGALYLGDECVLSASALALSQPDAPAASESPAASSAASRPVTVGIRPEAFLIDPDGPFTCTLSRLEIMGRDTSVISTHPAFLGDSIRSIVSSESAVSIRDLPPGTPVRFSLRPAKVHLFDPATGARIR